MGVKRLAAQGAGRPPCPEHPHRLRHERACRRRRDPDPQDVRTLLVVVLGLLVLLLALDLLPRLDQDQVVARVPAQRQRAGPERLVERLVERAGVTRQRLVLGRPFDPTPVELVQQLVQALGEDRHLDRGDAPCLVETSVGRIGAMICYDLRFPELARRLAVDGADIIVLPGEWPKPREEHWRTLIRARAIENQLFVVAANTCGVIGKLDFFGSSLIVGPKGEILAEGGYENCEPTAMLDPAEVASWRQSINCFQDRRPECY